MSLTSRIFLIAIFAVSLLGGYGCGSSSNNDQGTSFLALGFFDSTGANGENGAFLPLFTDISAQGGALSGFDGLTRVAFIGLQNRLATQFIRVVRVDCSYDVQGSSLTIPDDSFNFSTVLGGSDGGDGVANTSFSGFEIISPDIYSYLNNNQNSLPQLPFRMTVTCSATGITQAGDVLTTNPVQYFIQFLDIEECCPGTPGFQNGVGTGGDINFEDSSGTGSLDSAEFTTSEATDGEDSSSTTTTGTISTGTSDDDAGVISF